MKIRFYILQLIRTEGYGYACVIDKIPEQPKEGFNNKPDAINHLSGLFENNYAYIGSMDSFIITETYERG